MHKGEYILTIDTAHRDKNTLDTNFPEHDLEHNPFNVIKMEMGSSPTTPNNRVIFTDQSSEPAERKMPDFKVKPKLHSGEYPNGL